MPCLALLPPALAWTLPAAVALAREPESSQPSPDSPAGRAILAVSARPEEARAELRELYVKYGELVQARRDDGWQPGLLAGAIIESPDEPLLPARQLEDALANRERELSRVEQMRQAASAEDARAFKSAWKAKRREVKALKRQLRRAKGLSLDWSDAVWAELSRMKPDEWTIFDETREASPRHTAAVACSPPRRHAVCLVFDPWNTGEPDVYQFDSWNAGSFESRLPPEFFLHHLPTRGATE